MKISGISTATPSVSLKSVGKSCFTKDALYGEKKLLPEVTKSVTQGVAAISTGALLYTNDVLKSLGITHCEKIDGKLSLSAGYNGGYYVVNPAIDADEDALKSIVAHKLKEKSASLGGFINYKNMVSDLKRQDIIQKGLKIHSYELNNTLKDSQKVISASVLSKITGKKISKDDLFFIDEEAFYYDRLDKTAYSVNAYSQNTPSMKATYRFCKFETDNRNNAVGYTNEALDIFRTIRVEQTYREQQEPSEELPMFADGVNNKLFAEAFRFGNTKSDHYKFKAGIPKVLEHLSNKLGLDNLNANDLQFVRYNDKNQNRMHRICFYDSSVGRSIVYDETGKYMYQMQYNKDAFGKIIACSKF